MWSLLERWRGRSREARSRAAFIVAGSITSAVALVWLVSLPARFAETTESAASAIESIENSGTDSSAGNTLQDLVTTAEALRGQVPGSAATTSTTTKPAEVIPRRVLIGTTTAATTTPGN